MNAKYFFLSALYLIVAMIVGAILPQIFTIEDGRMIFLFSALTTLSVYGILTGITFGIMKINDARFNRKIRRMQP